ncbi:MAG: FAD-linked oxidase C-terminal domain-containing protein [Stappiaceae bacterium]
MTAASLKENASDNQSASDSVCVLLAEQFGQRFSTSESLREQHAHTTTWLPNQAPSGVVFPETTEEVAAVVKLCAEHGVPIIPFGVGTSLEGHVNAPFGGISIDLSNMNAVLEVNADDLDCRVQAGITRKQLNVELRETGLFFPIDPGADATLGGMAATRASGTNAVRYGTMRENVLGLTVVMADGQIIKTGGRARKSSAGYDLTHLLIGSEGTLGVITELTMKLHGIPESISGGLCPFPDIDAACNAVIMTIQCGLPVARIELLDEVQIRACNQYSKLTLAEKPTLFLEFHGSEQSVREQAERFGEISHEFGGDEFVWATEAEERSRLWQARHDAFWAGKSYRPGHAAVTTDVCVPISQLAACIHQTKEDIDELDLTAAIVGHVGDGNFHVLVLFDDKIAGLGRTVEGFVARLNERAIAMSGTCTGEHGIGQGKIKYLEQEHGEAVDIMRQLKMTLDPKGIMNPGKIF